MASPMLSIIKTELKRRKTYTLFWGIGIVVLTAFTVLAYGAVKSQADKLNDAFASFSNSAGSFFGTADMFSPTGYLNSQLFFIVLPILFIILGVTLSSALVKKEEASHTLELLLSRPISRTKLLIAKIITADTIFAILGVATFLTIVICSKVVGLEVAAGKVALATLMMVLFSGAFGAIAFMLYAAHQKTGKAAATVAIFLSLGGYIISSLAGLVSGLTWVARFFPYHYYDPGAILHGQVDSGLVAYIVGMFIVAVVIAVFGFRRRDIA